MNHNKLICTKMRDKNKSQVEFKGKATDGGSQLSRSGSGLIATNTMSSYFDQRNCSKVVEDGNLVERFESVFVEYANGNKNSNNDYVVDVKKIDNLVCEVLGADIGEFVILKFQQLSRKESEVGKVSWLSFANQVIPGAVKAIQSDCLFRRDLPALMKLMNRPRIVDPNIKALGELNTTYGENFNGYRKLTFNNSTSSFNHSETETSKTVSKHLFAGTTKGTAQLPGYRGHIPANVRNHTKMIHSNGSITHPVDNNLRLTQRGMGCVLGYTGHVPKEPNGDFTERMTSCDPRTMNGSFYGATRCKL